MFKIPDNLTRSLGKTCILYFIESGEFVKVGLTDNIDRRLFNLQLGNPLPLRLAYRRTIPRPLNKQVESLVHQRLAEWSIGREWFRMSARAAVKLADPVVKKANTMAERWCLHGIDLRTFGALSPEEVQQHIEINRI